MQNRKAKDISSLKSITDLQRSGSFTPHDPFLCECLIDPRNGGDVSEIMSPPRPFPIIPPAAVQLSQLETAETDARRGVR